MVCTDAFIFKVSQNILETSAFTQPKEKGRIPEAQHSTEQLAGMCVSVSVYLCVRERESISLQWELPLSNSILHTAQSTGIEG